MYQIGGVDMKSRRVYIAVSTKDNKVYSTNSLLYYYYSNISSFHVISVYLLEVYIEKNIKDDVEQCFASMKQEFVRKNYEFNSGAITIDAKLKPAIVEIVTSSDVSISKNGYSKTFSKFETFVPSVIYDLGFIANEIVAQEAQWCYFSNDGFMTLYPNYDIRVNVLDETTKIYTIMDKNTKDKLMMATRGCAMPAGLF